MSSEAQVALIVGIISAVAALLVGVIAATAALIGALGGAGLAWWLSSRSERRREKRAAFVELLSAMDETQQACSELSTAIFLNMDVSTLGSRRARVLSAVHRVEAAVTLAVFTVGPEHEQLLKDGGIACVNEMGSANHGVDSMGIVAPREKILKLGRQELR